ncbi:YheV family putative zinc ribbon protein [Acinetobacter larvae]|uniref:YheV family putative zinc ribbon protein n=1 Tax=Acinetobacter larvae TaxID=1789224 RepID=UPI00389904B0
MKRRFIAGAKCPKCQAMDRVVMLSDSLHDAEWIECIECGYSENRPTHVEPSTPEPADDIGVIQFKPRPAKH